MLKNCLSSLAICSVILLSNNFVFAQKLGDWGNIQNLVNQEIAVKVRAGKTIYGILRSVNDTGIKLQAAEKRVVSSNETVVSRSEIEKIWHANLFVNERRTGTGTLIGSVVGSVGMGGIALATAEGDEKAYAPAGFILGALPGALVGGTIGFFAKKKHKRGVLVFQE